MLHTSSGCSGRTSGCLSRTGSLFTAALAHHQAFLAVDPAGALHVDRPAVIAQTAVQHPAVAAAPARQFVQALAQ
jgi:hypothetical protein